MQTLVSLIGWKVSITTTCYKAFFEYQAITCFFVYTWFWQINEYAIFRYLIVLSYLIHKFILGSIGATNVDFT